MDCVRLGKTDLMIPRLGFGGIPIQRVSEDEAIAVVRRCLELGITFIDTANAYSNSEERIGKAISGRRDGLVLATKTTSRDIKGVEKHLKLSLERLGVNAIDLYQFHNVSDSEALNIVLDPDGPMVVVEEAKRAGVVKHIGVTSHSMDIAKELVKSGRFETIMFPLNFVTSEAADELLPLAREHDVGFIAMKPLAGGMLDNVVIAFKYLLQFPNVVIIPGIEKPHELDEIIKIFEEPWQITAPEKREMQRIREELSNNFCRRCDYCQPCTEGIPISTVMEFPSLVKRIPPYKLFSGFVADAMEKAPDCSRCGECEVRCPYKLSIMEIMEDHGNLYLEKKREYKKPLSKS